MLTIPPCQNPGLTYSTTCQREIARSSRQTENDLRKKDRARTRPLRLESESLGTIRSRKTSGSRGFNGGGGFRGDGHLFQAGCPSHRLHPVIPTASNVSLTTAPFRASPVSTTRK